MEQIRETSKGHYSGRVLFNRQIKPGFWRLGLEFSGSGAEAFGTVRPGQFGEFDLSGAALPAAGAIPEDLRDAAKRDVLLRRPFSFARVDAKGDRAEVEILYCVLGPATLRMTTLDYGDEVSVIGPLGNGYSVPEGKKRVILVAGGMGAAPLQHLAQVLTDEFGDIEVTALAGAKTKEQLPFEVKRDRLLEHLRFSLAEFARYAIESLVATDDGSAGFTGTVTDCLADWLGQNEVDANETIVYACGPERMLAAVAKLAREKNIDCQVSMERMMACGIGVCQSCAVECRVDGSSETVYKLCCKDGPVFDAKEIVLSV